MTRLSVTSLLALLMFCVTSSQLTVAAEPVLLQYQFSKGKPLRYHAVTTMDQSSKTQGRDMKMKMVNEADTEFSLNEITEDEHFSLTSHNKGLHVKMDNMMGPYEYDSESTENNSKGFLAAQLNPMFEKMTGAKLQVTLTPNGDIAKVTGYADLMKEALKSNPAAAQLMGGMSDETAKMQFSEMFPVLPDHPVAQGDSWEVEFGMPVGQFGDAKGKKKFTYIGPGSWNGRKCVTIGVEYEMKFAMNLKQGPISVTGELETTKTKGTVLFDPEAGEVLSVQSEYTIEGDLKVTSANVETEVDSFQKQTVHVELVPVSSN